VKVENIGGTAQPLYVVAKAERQQGAMRNPVTVAFEGVTDDDSASTLLAPVVVRRMLATATNGQNATIAALNPSATNAVSVTFRIFDGTTGHEYTPIVANVPPLGQAFINTRDNFTDVPLTWLGSVRMEATGPILGQVQPWSDYAAKTNPAYRAWAVYNPVDIAKATNTFYVPSVHRKATAAGARSGTGWNTSIQAVNLSTVATTTVQIQIFGSGGAVLFSESKDIAPNALMNWYTLGAAYAGALGSSYDGGAKVTVTGGAGPIAGLAFGSFTSYDTGTDGYTSYNATSQ
jgi:hypothetical protein